MTTRENQPMSNSYSAPTRKEDATSYRLSSYREGILRVYVLYSNSALRLEQKSRRSITTTPTTT